jgi:hypothetical protein
MAASVEEQYRAKLCRYAAIPLATMRGAYSIVPTTGIELGVDAAYYHLGEEPGGPAYSMSLLTGMVRIFYPFEDGEVEPGFALHLGAMILSTKQAVMTVGTTVGPDVRVWLSPVLGMKFSLEFITGNKAFDSGDRTLFNGLAASVGVLYRP